MLFPVWEREFFEKIKENEELRGGVCGYVAQVTPQFDAEIHKKRLFRTETTLVFSIEQHFARPVKIW